VVVAYKIWWAKVGTLSNFATLLRHGTANRLPTPGLKSHKRTSANVTERKKREEREREGKEILQLGEYVVYK
jgi:hypothetical protein